ncbi:MAG: PTS sugar transporter subunit IIA [Candidatus Goldbacteria bacterium]|nr:PTS sugar transporter subunit IIA [Candidatus Goldiibacteriota bacterium]
MTGIIIASHFTLAESLKETIELIIGKRENVSSASLSKNEKVENFSERLKNEVIKLNKDSGVIIFTDMFGGTPSNIALSLFAGDDDVKIISGFNLPIVIEAIMHSSKNSDEILNMLMEHKDKTIVDAKSIFKRR